MSNDADRETTGFGSGIKPLPDDVQWGLSMNSQCMPAEVVSTAEGQPALLAHVVPPLLVNR